VADHAADQRASVLAAAANAAVAATAAEVVTALDDAQIRSILLKGPSLTDWLYDSEHERFSVDVDLLVSPADTGAAEAVLSRLGFTAFPENADARSQPRHAHAWNRATSPIGVDLHTNLAGVGVGSVEAWRVLSRMTELQYVGGTRVDVLAPAARVLHVALHAAQHGARWHWGVDDLSRALERVPISVWREAAELAATLEATLPFAAGLALLPKGREVKRRLGLPDATTVEVALRATTPPDLALGLQRLATIPGLRAKSVFAFRKIFPPAPWMRTWLPLARRGRFGMAAAYGWRPVWLLLRAGPAIRALRRARKQSRAAST
jgi:hypothetical protein